MVEAAFDSGQLAPEPKASTPTTSQLAQGSFHLHEAPAWGEFWKGSLPGGCWLLTSQQLEWARWGRGCHPLWEARVTAGEVTGWPGGSLGCQCRWKVGRWLGCATCWPEQAEHHGVESG